MSSNLVLNINTPNYFGNSSKRFADGTFATVSAKKPKLALGKSLRVSSKLKVFSSIKDLNKNFIQNEKASSNSFKNRNNSKNVTYNTLKIKNVTRTKSQLSAVTFNSNVQYMDDNSHLDASPKISRPFVNANHSDGLKIPSRDSQGKHVTSSLFSRFPLLPDIPKVDVVSSSQEVFSTKTFRDLDIAPNIISNIEKFGYSALTIVQQLGIPAILEGKDALIKSQTGSGKTLSYAVPIVHKLMMNNPKIDRKLGTFALVVVPTRELAIQTYHWFEKLCKACVWVVPGYLIGGEKKKAEKSRIRKGINILVATPGRLTDHINNTNCLSLLNVQFLILDEADRMLEMGYENSIKSIIYALNEQKCLSGQRQTVLLSATLTTAVEKLAGISLNSPLVINVSGDVSSSEIMTSDSLVTPHNLSHFFMLVPPKLRLVTLAALLLEKCKLSPDKKILIFMTTQDMVDFHSSLFSLVLSRYGQNKISSFQRKVDEVWKKRRNKKYHVVKDENEDAGIESDEDNEIDEVRETDINFFKLHGNMSQPERTAVFKSFRDSKYGVLLSTDVASRGLDLPNVNWIIQYNPAVGASDYVHRVGRTARADLKGSAVVFINPTESTYVTMLEKHGIKFNEIRMEKVLNSLVNPSLYEADDPPKDMESAANNLQLEIENLLAEDKDMYHMATQGFTSFVRSYAAIPKEAREYFCFKLLHLGHFAKSFGLRDTPSVLGSKGGQYRTREFRNTKQSSAERMKPLLSTRKVVSEFDSGFDGCEDDDGRKKAYKKGMKDKKRQKLSFKTKAYKANPKFLKGKKSAVKSKFKNK